MLFIVYMLLYNSLPALCLAQVINIDVIVPYGYSWYLYYTDYIHAVRQ